MDKNLNRISYSVKSIQQLSEKDASVEQKYMSLIAKVSFAIYMFFVFFGTKIPFTEKAKDVEGLSTSNIVNQIVFGALFIISLITLIPKRSTFIIFVKREKFFFIFLIWSLITIIWSDHPFVSVKRYIQYVGTVTISLSVLFYTKDPNDSIKIFLYLLGLYILVSWISILVIPFATDQLGQWRGISLHKNLLGQVSLIAIIFFLNALKTTSLKVKAILFIFTTLSFVLILGSSSSTSLLTLMILVGISVTLIADKIFEPIGIGRTVSILISVVFLTVMFSILIAAPEIIASYLGSIGRDLTLTGRSIIWETIWVEVQKHFLLGAGFQGFWVVDSLKFEELTILFNDIINQSHNGYLDIINEVGMIGIILFLIVLINYFVNLLKVKTAGVWKWFIFAAIIINITESSFIIPRSYTGVMFIFSYFALFSDLIKDKQPDSITE